MTIKLTLPDGSVAEGTLEEIAQLLIRVTKNQTEGDETEKEFSAGDSDYDFTEPHNLEKIGNTARDLSFFKAGRELNEFKIGDIVRVLHSAFAHPKYSIIEITGFLEDGNILAKGYDDDVDSVEEYIYNAEKLELIAPAESRVDIRGDKENE